MIALVPLQIIFALVILVTVKHNLMEQKYVSLVIELAQHAMVVLLLIVSHALLKHIESQLQSIILAHVSRQMQMEVTMMLEMLKLLFFLHLKADVNHVLHLVLHVQAQQPTAQAVLVLQNTIV